MQTALGCSDAVVITPTFFAMGVLFTIFQAGCVAFGHGLSQRLSKLKVAQGSTCPLSRGRGLRGVLACQKDKSVRKLVFFP